jgi:formamidopyrimidine-DNA glycosylase
MVGWFGRPQDRFLHESEAHVQFDFGTDTLNFYDFRNFGTLTFTNDPATIFKEMDAIAPDILGPVTFREFYERLKGLDINKTLDVALMDQTLVFSGIGNIIKSEMLYDAGISPKRHIKDLSEAEWRRIFDSARRFAQGVLYTLKTRPEDLDAYYGLHSIYQKERDPNGRLVKEYKAADGRSTFYVPEIQH